MPPGDASSAPFLKARGLIVLDIQVKWMELSAVCSARPFCEPTFAQLGPIYLYRPHYRSARALIFTLTSLRKTNQRSDCKARVSRVCKSECATIRIRVPSSRNSARTPLNRFAEDLLVNSLRLQSRVSS